MTDLSTIVATSRTIDIKHPATGEPVGLSVTLLPDSDPKVEAARRRFLNERLGRNKKITAEAIQAQQTSLIVSAVTGWEWKGDATFEGEKPEFSEEALRKVLKKLSWVKDQLDTELGDEAAFFTS